MPGVTRFGNRIMIPADAAYHIDRAITLAVPDRFYGLLSEYYRVLGPLQQERIEQVDPGVWQEVKKLYKVHNEGWSKLSGTVRARAHHRFSQGAGGG